MMRDALAVAWSDLARRTSFKISLVYVVTVIIAWVIVL